jgi:hypothetical protein
MVEQHTFMGKADIHSGKASSARNVHDAFVKQTILGQGTYGEVRAAHR